jgi:hypothetical protein
VHVQASAIEKLLSAFIRPLQSDNILTTGMWWVHLVGWLDAWGGLRG